MKNYIQLQSYLVFESIGVYPAQNFFEVDRTTGGVRVIRSLREDSLGREIYTLRCITYDFADPEQRDTADVTIRVTRNPSGPLFSEASYERTIPENYPLGPAILTVLATDQDGVRFISSTFIMRASSDDLGKKSILCNKRQANKCFLPKKK